MPEIIYDRTWYHDARTYITQALDPCNTFQTYVENGTITRANVLKQATEYLEWLIQEDGDLNVDPEELSSKAARLTEQDLERYLLGLIEEHEGMAR